MVNHIQEAKINIFYLDISPTLAAQYAVDRHVVKMILETCQLLSTAHRVLDGTQTQDKSKTGRKVTRYVLNDYREDILYQATHINHPSSVWCRQNVENYQWLHNHLMALLNEYTYRYGKVHKCMNVAVALYQVPNNILPGKFTDPTPAMKTEFLIENNSLKSYRNYYKTGKVHLHKYTKRQPPNWMTT